MRRRWLCAFGAVVFLLALSACSDDDSDDAARAPQRSDAQATSVAAGEAATVQDLVGRSFALAVLIEAGKTYELVEAPQPTSIAFTDVLLTLSDGCNGTTGEYALDEAGRLTISDALVTRVGCVDEVARQARQLNEVAVSGAVVTIDGPRLWLRNGSIAAGFDRAS